VKLVALALAALVLAAPAAATSRPSVAELETELVCPECHETLDESSAPIANEMKALLRKRVAQGWTKKQIIDEMVANFGPNVLSTPSKHGFDLLAWVLPLGGAAVGIAGLGYGARYWSHTVRVAPVDGGLDPEMERRIDDELDRFDG
jgi:cytochrome c-type biogenesis protein CcmH